MSTTKISVVDQFAQQVRDAFKVVAEQVIEEETALACENLRKKINTRVSALAVDMASEVSVMDRHTDIMITLRKQF